MAVVAWPKTLIASSEVNTASPIAVDCSSCSLSIAVFSDSRSSVGGTSTLALPPNATSPRLIRAGIRSTNFFAAVCAATIRDGSTSVASIDSDTSIAITTVARSRGTRTAAAGRATPMLSTDSAMSNSANVRCRRHPGRRGATLPSSSTLLNRATNFVRRSCTTTYAAAITPTGTSSQSHCGDRKLISAPPCRSTRRRTAAAPPRT